MSEGKKIGVLVAIVGVICGPVNSRNGFGGMTGPQQFISRLGVMTVFKDDVADGGFADTWDSVCP